MMLLRFMYGQALVALPVSCGGHVMNQAYGEQSKINWHVLCIINNIQKEISEAMSTPPE
jgi:hypothetical protein